MTAPAAPYRYTTFGYGDESKRLTAAASHSSMSSLLERVRSRTDSPARDIVMRPLADQISVHESVHSEQSCDTAQHGVKRLEAISSTWTRSGLAVAYIG